MITKSKHKSIIRLFKEAGVQRINPSQQYVNPFQKNINLFQNSRQWYW